MKHHRWVTTFAIPTKVIMNEDGQAWANVGMGCSPYFVLGTFCCDCEESLDEAFGRPCLSEPQGDVEDEAWEGIL